MPLLSDMSYDQEHHDKMVDAIRTVSTSLPQTIELLAEAYVSEYAMMDVSDINDGCCYDFANDLKSIFPKINVSWIDELSQEFSDIAHFVAFLDGKYYDAEVPFGVENLHDIPLIIRLVESD